jgi:hypothetical protein
MLRLQLITLPYYLASIARFPYLKIVRIIGEAKIALSGTLPYFPSKIHCYADFYSEELRTSANVPVVGSTGIEPVIFISCCNDSISCCRLQIITLT